MRRVLAVALCALATAAAADDDDDSFSLTPNKDASRECRAKDGSRGICVHHSYCNKTMHYLPYGIIDENEERIGRECPGQFEWCCTAPPEYLNADGGGERTHDDGEPCAANVDGACAWCLDLHKMGGNPHTMSASGKFCAGALLPGGRAALTTASCVRAARGRALRVTAADGRSRIVASATLHPQYDSGTKLWDVAVLVLDGEALGGGCGLRASGEGECVMRWRGGAVVGVKESTGRCAGVALEGAVCVRGGDGGCGGAGEAVMCGGRVSALVWGACGGTSVRGAGGVWVKSLVAQYKLQERVDHN